MEHFIWLWIGLMISAIAVEVLTEQLVSIWFVPGAIVSAVLSLCKVDILWQVLVFVVVSGVGIVIGKMFLSKKKPTDDSKTNIDAIIGENCVVAERVDNYAGCGLVKVKGQIWSARGVSENDTFEVGEVLSVVAIEGVKLICKKK